MNKTNPIGVRFRADLLEKLKFEFGVDSPQKALVFYERFFLSHGVLSDDAASSTQEEDSDEVIRPAIKPEREAVKSNKYQSSMDEMFAEQLKKHKK